MTTRKTQTKPNFTIAAIDIGYLMTKAARLSNSGKPIIVHFPTIMGYPETLRVLGGMLQNGAAYSSAQNIQMHTQDGLRFVGDLAINQSRITWSPKHRNRGSDSDTLTYALAAISELNIEGDIKIVTGLPADWLEEHDEEMLRQQLLGKHTIKREGHSDIKANVVDVEFLPQPAGTFYRQLLGVNERGKIVAKNRTLTKQAVNILDPGGHTTDLIRIEAMEYKNNRTHSVEFGMHNVTGLLIQHIKAQYRLPFSHAQAEEVIKTRKIQIGPKSHDATQMIDEVLKISAYPLRDAAIDTWNDLERRDITLGTGGGGNLLCPYLVDILPELNIVENGFTANVEGFLYFGHTRWG